LIDLNLAPNNKVKDHYWKGILYGMILLLSFGGIKLYFGIVRDKSIGFLIALIIIAVFALFRILRPSKINTSALGKKVIKNAEQRFDWIRTNKENSNLLMDDNLLYGVAIFGISAFIHSELGETLASPLLLDSTDYSSYNNSGCSGCGNDSDSGSSDGGCSSGCGGGCGGCGGD